ELEQDSPFLNKPPNLEESEALAESKFFLKSFGVDTSAISLRNRVINKEERTLKYRFLYSKPSPISSDLKENYTITITGRNVTSYRAKTLIDFDSFEFPDSDTRRTASILTTIGMWVVLGIVLIGIFFRRLKHDVLEFKRGVWLGLAAGIMMLAFVSLQIWPDWQEILIAGGFSGLFTGIGILFVYPVAESINREVWQRKIALTDILLRGFIRVRELGAAFLHALALSGITLLAFALLFALAAQLKLGRLSFDEDLLWFFKGNSSLIANFLQTTLSSLFIGLVLFSFSLSYLKTKIRNRAILIIVFAFVLDLAGLHLYYLKPSYVAFFLFMPIALLWAYYGYKADIISILIALFLVNFLLEISFIHLHPNGFSSTPAIVSIGLISILLFSGSYLIFTKTSIADFKHYVPSYVNRIAEKERFLKELEIARTVQLNFLPREVPKIPHLDIASICRPAMEVGGDYYDFIRNGRDSLGIVLGDVSGKGVSAAFYMTMVKGIVKTLTKSIIAPKKILTEMNAIFYENAPNQVFISMVYGLFDTKNLKLTFARAGHNPIIVHKNSIASPQLLQSNGLAIGLDKGQIFTSTIEEQSVPIEVGDVFVFFTDGITESMDKNGDEFGEERLRQVVSASASHSAQTILDNITEDVKHFCRKTDQHDDFTMVVVKVEENISRPGNRGK
ncbi:MAG: PP2C family protein-serine/threonine phosphatase, partial [bacterium]